MAEEIYPVDIKILVSFHLHKKNQFSLYLDLKALFRDISGLKWRLKISRNIPVKAHDSLRQLVPSTSPMNVRDSTRQSPTVLLGLSRRRTQRLRRSWVP